MKDIEFSGIGFSLMKIQPISKKKLFSYNEIKQQFNQRQCYFSDQSYCQKVQQIFQIAIQSQFTLLNLVRNYNQSMLLQISHIKFNQLRVLQLQANQIQSIEPLAWLDAKNLRTLDLQQNLIVSGKPFAKFYFHNVSQLKIGTNLYNQLDCLARMRCRHNVRQRDFSLNCIYMNYQRKPYDKPISNLNFLGKSQQPRKMNQQWINLQARNRIKSVKLHQCLKRKLNKLKIGSTYSIKY